MAEVIRMPRLSDTMTEGVIVSWNKKVGDKIKPGDVLADVETDKATMELESYNEGTLLFIGVEAGKAVKVDGILAVVGKAGEDYQSLLEKTESVSKTEVENIPTTNITIMEEVPLPKGAKEIRMPLLSDTMTEGKIVSWNKKLGDKVKSDDVIAEVETDKATMEIVGYEEGTLLYLGIEAGKAAKINEIIAIVGAPGTDVSAYVAAEKNKSNAAINTIKTPEVPQEKPVTQPTAVAVASEHTDGRVKASPLAKKIAADKGIDLTKMMGSGDGGRVIKKDVDEYTPVSTGSSEAQKTFTPSSTEGFTDIPLTQMRKTIARRLAESKFSAPHFYLTIEINMDNAMTTRSAINEAGKVKISFNDIIIKACATALKKHPDVNSSWMGDFIRQNHHVHIGSAVAMPDGLIVPVIKFADQKTMSQIATEAKELYTKAKEKKLQPSEFSGNTFTISNLGMMDIEEFTAIINPPDSCILAVGKIKEIVVKKPEGFGVTNVMKLTLSCDHRSVDGAIGAAFLQTLKKYLENPIMMLV